MKKKCYRTDTCTRDLKCSLAGLFLPHAFHLYTQHSRGKRISELIASLVNALSVSTARATHRKPVFKNWKQKKEESLLSAITS